MKRSFIFCCILGAFLLPSCISAPVLAYEYVTGNSDREEYDKKYPEKHMTAEQIEQENKKLDQQGYR